MWIKVLRPTIVNRQHCDPGALVDAPETEGRYLCSIRKAEPAKPPAKPAGKAATGGAEKTSIEPDETR